MPYNNPNDTTEQIEFCDWLKSRSEQLDESDIEKALVDHWREVESEKVSRDLLDAMRRIAE